jgi:hypothetical protein
MLTYEQQTIPFSQLLYPDKSILSSTFLIDVHFSVGTTEHNHFQIMLILWKESLNSDDQ